jgi:hypothetical protein
LTLSLAVITYQYGIRRLAIDIEEELSPMKCPNCDHVSEKALLRCGDCGETYDRDTLERFQHLGYLLDWLDEQDKTFGANTIARLKESARDSLDALRLELLPPAAPEPTPQPKPDITPVDGLMQIDTEMVKIAARLTALQDQLPGWLAAKAITAEGSGQLWEHLNAQIQQVSAPAVDVPADSPKPPDIAPKDLDAYALDLLSEWAAENLITENEHERLRSHLSGELPLSESLTALPSVAIPAETSAAPAVVAPIKPRPAPRPPRPKTPPKPREPLIKWDELWKKVVEAAVSGLLLRWLRYLGAFLFVVSLAIVVISFWDAIPQLGQLTIIFFVPTAFYGGGWFLRRRLDVIQTGGVLMGVGQLLLAVAFAAIYQFGGLDLPVRWYWLATSSLCMLLYILTAWRLVREEFFGYISLAGIGSTLMAAVFVLTNSPTWALATLIGLGALGAEAAFRLNRAAETWQDLARSGQRFPLVILPVGLLLLLAIPGLEKDPARLAGSWLAVAGLGTLAVRFPRRIYTHLAAWGFALAVGLTLWGLEIPGAWLASVAALLSPLYILVYRRLAVGLSQDFPHRSGHLMAFQRVGLGLSVLAAAAGLITLAIDYWPAVVALTLVSAGLGLHAALLRRPAFVLLAAGSFLLPYSLTLLNWLADVPQQIDWLMAGWAVLSILYLAGSSIGRSNISYMRWLTLVGQGLLPPVLAASIIAVILEFAPGGPPRLAAVGLTILAYILSASLNDLGKLPGLSAWLKDLPFELSKTAFLYAIAVLIPIWTALAWWGSVLVLQWLGAALAGISLAFIGIGQLLRRRDAAYRFPFHLLTYPVGAAAIVLAFFDSTALISTLFLDTAALVVLAWIYLRSEEIWLAAPLFLWPVSLILRSTLLIPQAYSIVYILLSGLGYLSIGVFLQRRESHNADRPVLIVGYVASVLALGIALWPHFDPGAPSASWIGVVIPLLATAIYIFSTHAVHPWFAWAAALALPLGFWQGMVAAQIPAAYDPVGWLILGIFYLLLGWLVQGPSKKAGRSGLSAFRWPIAAGAGAIAMLGLALISWPTAQALLTRLTTFASPTELVPVLISLGLAILFVILAAVIYRSRWPLFLEPGLAFFVATVFVIGFGEPWFGGQLAAPKFGILWAGLGLLHFTAATLVDRIRTGLGRSPHTEGLHLGALFLTIIALLWALFDRTAFTWSIGSWVLFMTASAVLVHRRSHPTWETLIGIIIPAAQVRSRRLARTGFIWSAAWTLPIWASLLLWELNVLPAFGYLGYMLSALAFLGAAAWLRKQEPSYRWPLVLAGQFYVLLALATTAWYFWPVFSGNNFESQDRVSALGFVLVHAAGVIYYAGSAWYFKAHRYLTRGFGYAASVLAIVPVSLAGIVFIFEGLDYGLAYFWIGLAAALCGSGYVLDQRARVSSDSHTAAQGPYLVGYAVSLYAVIYSWPSSLVHLIVLGAAIVIALASQFALQRGRHTTYAELLNMLWPQREPVEKEILRVSFLSAAALVFPIWLSQLLWQLNVLPAFGYLGYPISALVFLGAALWLKRLKRSYAWPLLLTGQVYTLFGLGVSAWYFFTARAADLLLPENRLSVLGYVILHTLAIGYYAASSAYFRRQRWMARAFGYAYSGLAIIAITQAGIVFIFNGLDFRLAYLWLGLATLLVAGGYLLDRLEALSPVEARVGFAHGPYLVGYGLTAYAVLWSWAGAEVHLYVLAAALVITAASQVAVQLDRHPTFLEFLNTFWRKGETFAKRAVRAGFLFIAAYGLPVWLAEVLAYNDVVLAWRGLALALAAPLYIAFGLAVRHVRTAYTWPLYTAGYLLTAVGAMISFGDPLLAMYVLGLNALVYAASAYIFRQGGWLYLATVLVPIIFLMVLDFNLGHLPASWVSVGFMLLAFGYLGAGRFFDRRQVAEIVGAQNKWVSPFALPFYGPGYLLSAVALAVASIDRPLAIIVYLSAVLLYGLSARLFRESIFLYPAVWLAAVPYYLAMTFTILSPSWYGIGWLPLILTSIIVGRSIFQRGTLTLTSAAMPFFILAYALSVSMIAIARTDALALTLAFAAAMILYTHATRLFRRSEWLYASILAGHLALFSAFGIDPLQTSPIYLPLAFMPITWALILLGAPIYQLPQAAAQQGSGLRGSLTALITHRASPFLLFGILDITLWQIVALPNPDLGIILAGSHALLLAVLAGHQSGRRLVFASLSFLILAIGLRLAWAGLSLGQAAAAVAGIGFLLYMVGRVAENLSGRLAMLTGAWQARRRRLSLWVIPLSVSGMGINALGAVVTLLFVFREPSYAAAGLAFIGALYLAVAYQRSHQRLGYAAVAMLEIAFIIFLIMQDISQPQLFAIPAGLYLIGVGVFERRVGRRGFAQLLENLGLSVLLLTSLIQSMSLENGFWYFLLLLAEGLAVIAWAVQQRRKGPFLIGIGASAANAFGQVVVVFLGGSTLIRWVIFGAVGLSLLMAAVYAERWIIPRAQELRERLESWA